MSYIDILKKEESSFKLRKNDNIKSYINYLKFHADTGDLREVYESIFINDQIYIKLNKVDVESNNTYKNIYAVINKITDGQYSYIKPLLLGKSLQLFNNDKFKRFLNEKLLKFISNKKENSHEENLIINFILNRLLWDLKNSLTAKDIIQLFNYFYTAKNCNKTRRDYVLFSLVAYCIKNNVVDFFKLSVRFYNHIQKVYERINNTEFLNNEERMDLLKSFNREVKKFNALNSKSRLKIAVCISGVYRGHENAIKSIYENVVKPLKADVFIHTWDKRSVWSGIGGTPKYQRVFGVDAKKYIPKEFSRNVNLMKEFFPNAYQALKDPIEEPTDEEYLQRALSPKKIQLENEQEFVDSLENTDGFTKLRGSLNQVKMFYGIKKSIDLALNHSRYDYLIRIRPDLQINSEVSLKDIAKLENNSVYAKVAGAGINDRVFTMSESVAFSFSRFVELILELRKLSPYDDFPLYDSHNLIGAWAIENNYTFDKDIIKDKKLLPNIKIKIPSFKEAIDQDISTLDTDTYVKYGKFIAFLKENYA